MGAACSRKGNQETFASDGENEQYNTQPRQPWPSPNNLNGPSRSALVMPQKNVEAMEKVMQEPARARISPRGGIKFFHHPDDYSFEAASSYDGAMSDDREERNKEEKKRLSRMLSEKANSVRSMTTKGASRVSAKPMCVA